MLELFLWLSSLWPGLNYNEGGSVGREPLPPSIPPEALRMVHHNARCGGEAPTGVTDPPLRGSLRDRMQRARH